MPALSRDRQLKRSSQSHNSIPSSADPDALLGLGGVDFASDQGIYQTLETPQGGLIHCHLATSTPEVLFQRQTQYLQNGRSVTFSCRTMDGRVRNNNRRAQCSRDLLLIHLCRRPEEVRHARCAIITSGPVDQVDVRRYPRIRRIEEQHHEPLQ